MARLKRVSSLGLARARRIEIRQRDQRQHFAGLQVQDDAGAADAVEVVDGAVQLLVQDVLHAHVDRELQRPRAALQQVVERALDAGEAAAVDIGEADQVRGERAVRIDALGLRLEIDAGQAEAVDRLLLARRQVALQPDEAAVGVELGGGRGDVEVRQHRVQHLRGLVRILHLARVGIERGGGEAGRQHHAVAVDDVGAVGLDLGLRHHRGLGAVRQQRDGDQARRR